MKFFIFLATISLLFSCKREQPIAFEKTSLNVEKKITDSLKHKLEISMDFISDSLLHKDRTFLRKYLNQYTVDTCGYIPYNIKKLKEEFDGFKPIGDVNGDGKKDTVFIIQPFNYCDEGKSYYFFDTSIHRIYTDTYCVGLERFFTVPDIDEDGADEVAFYASSCASRYKGLYVYSLKNNAWKEVGAVTFDIITQDPEKTNFESLIKKTGKGTFKMCEFNEGQTQWLSFTIK